jgi:TRAP-type transport system periplasmic protein
MVRVVTEAKYVLARGKWPTRSVRCPMHPSCAPPKVGSDERTLMRDHTKTLAVSIALLVAAGTAGCTSTGDRAGGTRPVTPLVLKVLNTRGPNDIQPFVDQVKTLSGGRITLDVTNKWHSADVQAEPDAIKAVEAGKAAIGFVPTRAFHDLGVTSFDALNAPLTVDSLALEQRVLGSDLATTMLKGVATMGLHGLGVLPGPMRKPVGLTRTLIAPSDYRGARIAISASPVSARALAALGASPVANPFEGASMAQYDGIEQQIESVDGNHYDATGSTITANVNLWARPIALFANTKMFDALPAGTRALLQKAAVSALPAATRVQAAAAAGGLGNLCRRGRIHFVDATAAQVAQLRTAFDPVYAWLRGYPATAAAIDRINAMRSGLEDAVTTETPSCQTTGGGTGQANAGTPLDGVWKTTFSKADLAASTLIDPEEINDDNWGTQTLTFANGQYTQTETNAVRHSSSAGTYAVKGAILVMHQENGEIFTMRWSIYKDTLTLRRDKTLGVGPTPLVLKPWAKVNPGG